MKFYFVACLFVLYYVQWVQAVGLVCFIYQRIIIYILEMIEMQMYRKRVITLITSARASHSGDSLICRSDLVFYVILGSI